MRPNPPTDPLHWSLDYIKGLKTDSNTAFFDFSAPAQDDIYSEETWSKANPFIAHYLKKHNKINKWTYDFYKSKAELAKDSKEAEMDFRRQLLGQRVATDAFKFCEADRIQVTDDSVYKDKSLRWALGIDPAWKFNYFSASLVGINENTETLFIKHFLFMANLEKRRKGQKVQFTDWDKQGYIKVFNKETNPRDQIIDTIQDYLTKKDIYPEKVMVDPGQAKQWDFEKSFKGVEYVLNSPRHMTGAIRYLEKIIHEKKCFFIGKNPAALIQYDSAIVSPKSQDYCSIDKASVWSSVDCVVSSTLGVKHLSETKKKIYHAFYC